MGSIIDGVWKLIVAVFLWGSFSCFLDLTARLGKKAVDAHQVGLVGLPELNDKLFSDR